MLPGFRFLFAAIVLTVSLVVFGLGAAALLRASQERFASLPTRPAPGPVFPGIPDSAPPTLALLRVEPAPVETSVLETVTPPADTLLPADRMAALSTISRIENIVAPPSAAEAKPDPAPEPVAAIAEPVVADTPPLPAVADAPPRPAPVETVVAAIAEPLRAEAPAVSDPEADLQQVASLPDQEITGGTPAPVIAEPLLVNAKPIRRPPVPAERPAAADIVAALPDPALATPATETIKPIVRKRKPVVKRVVVKKPRVVVRAQPRRPAAPASNPASPFGAPGFGTTGFGASPFGT